MPMIKDPRWAAINLDGTPAAGAYLYVYANGTDNLADLYYSDNFDDNNRAPNPMVADGRGYFNAFYAATGDYKIKIITPSGADISQVENVSVA